MGDLVHAVGATPDDFGVHFGFEIPENLEKRRRKKYEKTTTEKYANVC